MAELVEVYIERHARTLRTGVEEERRLRADVLPALGHLRLVDLSRRQIADLLHRKAESAKERGGNGTTANRLRSLLQRLLNKGIEWGHLDSNPAEKVGKVVEEASRARVLTDDELEKLWQETAKLPDYRTRSILQLLILTGQRVSEVAGMTRAEVSLDLATWTIPAARAKNGRAHSVPLAAPAVRLLDAALQENEGFEHLFPAPDTDFLESCVSMRVPPEKVSDLVKFDGSLVVNRTKGTVGAICDKEEHNILSLNLAHDIVSGTKSVEEARQYMAKAIADEKAGRKDPLSTDLQFRPDLAAADPDQPARMLGAPEDLTRPGRDLDKNRDMDKDKDLTPGKRPGELPKSSPEVPRR